MSKTNAKMESKTRPDSLAELKKSINKDFGDGAIMQGRSSIVSVEIFPTYVATIDRALGCGGLPQGRIVEIFGHESSGKTTTCLQFIAACQRYFFPNKKRTGTAAFIDVEHALDPDWAAKCGVDMESLLLSQPSSGEEAFDIARRLVESGLVDLIIIDSVAALVPQAELDGEIKDSSIGVQARLMSKGLRTLKGPVNKTKTTVVFINQMRQKIGVMFGSNETTSGGLALKFYASIRAQISKGSALKGTAKDAPTLGFRPTLKIIKNKCAPPFTIAEYDICVGHPDRPVYGIDEEASLLDVGETMKIIGKSGSFYTLGDERLGNGRAAATACVKDNAKIRQLLMEKIYGSLRDSRAVMVDSSESELEPEPPDGD